MQQNPMELQGFCETKIVLALNFLHLLMRLVDFIVSVIYWETKSSQHSTWRIKVPREIYVHAVINVNLNSSYCISNVQLLNNNPTPASSLHAVFAGMEFYWEHNLFRHCHTHTQTQKCIYHSTKSQGRSFRPLLFPKKFERNSLSGSYCF